MFNRAIRPPERPTLYAHYLTTLQSQLARLDAAQTGEASGTARLADIGAQLKRAETGVNWNVLYRAELDMADLMPEAELKAEFGRRAQEAEEFKVPTLGALRVRFEQADNVAERRASFRCLLEDVLWAYNKRSLDRNQRSEAAKRLAVVGGSLILGIIVSLLVGLWRLGLGQIAVTMIVFVILPGGLGALFSRLQTFQSELSTLNYDRIVSYFQPRYVFIRLLVGAVGAITLYFVFLGSLLGGSLFPTLTQVDAQTGATALIVAGSGPDLINAGKLMFWSFLAGFSERLVTGTLGRFEKKAEEAQDEDIPGEAPPAGGRGELAGREAKPGNDAARPLAPPAGDAVVRDGEGDRRDGERAGG